MPLNPQHVGENKILKCFQDNEKTSCIEGENICKDTSEKGLLSKYTKNFYNSTSENNLTKKMGQRP